MDKGRFLVEAHLREGRSVAELARTHGVHPSWIYRLLARYREEGEEGLVPRSGAETLHIRLTRRHGTAPSVSTVMRVLRRRGCVAPEPKKRPRSSFIRFAAGLPNECWQSDMTHWALSAGRGVEIVNVIDDHSRLCVAAVVLRVTKALDVVEIFENARQRYGTPASILTDNGAIFTANTEAGRRPSRSSSNAWGWSASTPVPTIPKPAARWSASTRP